MKTLLVIILICILSFVSGCFESQTFDEMPPDLDKRTEMFEQVSQTMESLKTANVLDTTALLKHEDPRVRRAAILRLEKIGIGSPVAVSSIALSAKKDEAPRVRTAAVRVLGSMGGTGGADAVLAALCDPISDVRLYAWKSILKLGNDIYPALIEHMRFDSPSRITQCRSEKNPKHTVRNEIHSKIPELGIRAVPSLTDALTHEDEWVQNAAIKGLKHIGSQAQAALPELCRIVESGSSEKNRILAIHAVEKIGDKHPFVMPALFKAKSDPAEKISKTAQRAIRSIENAHRNQPNKTNKRKSQRPR